MTDGPNRSEAAGEIGIFTQIKKKTKNYGDKRKHDKPQRTDSSRHVSLFPVKHHRCFWTHGSVESTRLLEASQRAEVENM